MIMAESTDFRESIKQRMDECEMTQRDVCRLADVNPGNFSRWLNNRETGKISTAGLEAIADALNMDLEHYDECPNSHS